MERQIKKEDLLFKVIGKDQAKWYQPTPIKFDLGRYTPEEIAELRIEAYNLEIKHNIKDQTSKENSIKSGLLRKDQVKNPNSLTQGQFCCMNLNTSRGSQAIPGVFIPIQHIIQGSKLSFPPLSNYMPALPTKSQFKDTGKIKIPEKSPLELDTQTDVIREENPNKIIDLKENTHQKKVNPSEVIEISDSSESEGSTCNLNSNLQIIVPGHDKPQGSEKEDLTTRTSLLSNQHKMNLLSPHKLLVKKDRKESYQKSTGESADTPRGFQPIKRGFQVFRPSSNIEENQRLSSIFGNKPFKIIKERKPEKPCTENMEAIILSNPQKYMSRPQDEEFAVQLKMDDSDDDSELYRNAIDFSMPAKQPDPQQEVTEIKPESMSEYILKLIETRRKTQALIDEGNFIKRGPGRNRKSKFPTTEKVKKLINEFFIKGFEKLNMNKYNNTRTDACVTMYQRNLKKITLFLLEKVSVRNKYKCNDPKQFLMAYCETFVLFDIIFLKEIQPDEILKRFLEFSCIYYPTGKVVMLAEKLWEEGTINEDFKVHVEKLATMRDQTSKKSFNNFVRSNFCMRRIVNYCRKLFDDQGKDVLKGRAAGCVQKLLYTFD